MQDGNPQNGIVNQVARDAYGLGLSYYQDDAQNIADYKPIGSATNFKPFANAGAAGTGYNVLYNGNISGMSVNLPKAGDPLLYTYRYDQLNRLTSMFTYKGLNPVTNSWNVTATQDYRENISYDPNGNILTYSRNGAAAVNGTSMDNLTYQYPKYANTTANQTLNRVGKIINNRLRYVLDEATSTYTEDIKSNAPAGITTRTQLLNEKIAEQAGDNYNYDEIGNLVKDTKEGISNITWNVYGKILSITKAAGTIQYTYDASGNRISKTYNGKSTWYVRDASGNVMSVYGTDAAINDGKLMQNEVDLYGSSRLGIWNANRDVSNINLVSNITNIINFTRGNKFFELTNHLGNVLATVTEKKIGVDDGVYNLTTGAKTSSTPDGIIDYYTADVATANDYYPFGMGMPGRKYSSGSSTYRYSINGQEKESELNENITTAEYWEYDSRIGRRWNVDPVIKPWESPYATFNNNPISQIDPGGLDGTPYKVKKGDNLSKIAKRAGTTVDKLAKINGIKNTDKIKAGETLELYANPTPKDGEMLGSPEQNFSSSPLTTSYNNPVNEKFSYSVSATTKELGASFVSDDGRIPIVQNTVIMGGGLLNEVKNLPTVKNLMERGMQDLKTKNLEPGEYFKSSYSMGNILTPDGQRIWKQVAGNIFTKPLSDNYFFSAEDFLGSYGFSMRVTGDGKRIAICVYDSKTIGSLADHRAWLEKRLPDLAPTYQRYLWYVPIKNNKK